MADVEARLDETALISRCCEGDAGAFDVLVGAHASRVFNLAFRMLGSQQDAEDAAQEAFLRAFSALKKFRQGAKFSTWIHRIAVNVCLDELKRRHNRPQPLTSVYEEREGNPVNPAELTPADPATSDPAEMAARRAEQQEVQRALEALPPHQRAVVAMCDIEGLTYEEAAASLNIGIGTVKSRLHRAREKLRQLLAPTGN